ncbi:hypothetical protein [Algoriphagus vanfongensis]|uniref:hypothetical protein n=1 Tax=Algoriphagus vanfongensis TaxID=426371 RepID=UPI00047DB20A|nr:hypothetical protein [Algoriphagus vanfongensis]
MKGINLEIDQSIITGIIDSNNYSLSLSLMIRHSKDEEQVSLVFSGYDKDEDKQLEYYVDRYFGEKVNKEIKIKLVENEGKASIPVKEVQFDESFNNEMLLRSYRKLEEQLKTKGLI